MYIHRTSNAIRSDSVRRPIRFRPPSDQIPSAVRSDCVRVTMTFREVLLRKYKNMRVILGAAEAGDLRYLFAKSRWAKGSASFRPSRDDGT